MLGPNVKDVFPGCEFHGLQMDHRGHRFRELMFLLQERFRQTFRMPDFTFLFVTGSGTFANEIILSSIRGTWQMYYCDAKFGGALARMSRHHIPVAGRDAAGPWNMAYVAYETSISRLNYVPFYSDKGSGSDQRGIIFADMVSAFPYYDVPDSVDVFTTVSSKQIGAFPVIGVIGIRKTLNLDMLLRRGRGASCLDLHSYVHAAAEHQTPHTPAIPLYADLLDTLDAFDLDVHRQKLDQRRKRIEEACNPAWLIGTGPVVTIGITKETEEVGKHHDLYRSDAGYQIFTWTGRDSDYDALCKSLGSARQREGIRKGQGV